MRQVQDGHVPAIRTGMIALSLGAMTVIVTLFLIAPAMDGMVGIGDHQLDRPVAQPRTETRPELTPMQRAVARRTAVRVAAGEVGVRERRGDNRGARINTYRRATTGPGERAWVPEPWCADFVSWAWRRAGVPIGFDGRGSDYVPELVAWARLTRRWHWARDGYRPQPGDLIVFKNGGSMRGHIGMVAKVRNGTVYTIEGNYSDRVGRRSIKAWRPVITGFIAPV